MDSKGGQQEMDIPDFSARLDIVNLRRPVAARSEELAIVGEFDAAHHSAFVSIATPCRLDT